MESSTRGRFWYKKKISQKGGNGNWCLATPVTWISNSVKACFTTRIQEAATVKRSLPRRTRSHGRGSQRVQPGELVPHGRQGTQSIRLYASQNEGKATHMRRLVLLAPHPAVLPEHGASAFVQIFWWAFVKQKKLSCVMM